MEPNIPKIAFAYPTWIRSGQNLNGPYLPDLAMLVKEFPKKVSFYLNMGLMLNINGAYSIDVNVFYENEPLILDNRPAIGSVMKSVSISSKGDFISISSMLMNDIVLSSTGTYTIRTTLFNGPANDNDKKLLDEYDCFFMVSTDWQDIIMPEIGGDDGATS